MTVSLVGGTVGVVSMAAAPFVWLRPNRVVEGEAATALSALGELAWVALGLWLLACVGAFWDGRIASRSLGGSVLPLAWRSLRMLAGSGALLLLLAAAGTTAYDFAATQGEVARTSFGWGFYLFLLALYLLYYSASGTAKNRVIASALVAAPLAGVVVLAAVGSLGELGIVREWALTRSTFGREFGRHLFYALGATGGAVVLGIPLGVISAKHRRTKSVVMGALNLGQVLPVLAFIGIMMPVMGALGRHIPGLRALGVAGIGWAPVMIVLLVYALFPIARNTLVAIQQLEPGVLDAAKGSGMNRSRTFFEVELPLAFPVVLAGIRVALVQSTAGAIIAAFVGGGGLGTIMFLGLEQTSMDLVLVGVIPIILLALCFDALLRAVEYLTGRRQKTSTAMVGL